MIIKVNSKIKIILKNYIFIFKTVYDSNKWIFFISILSTIIVGILPVLTSMILRNIIYIVENAVKLGETVIQYRVLWSYVFLYVGVYIVKDIVLDCRLAIYRIAGMNLTYNMQSKIIEKLKTIEYYMFYKPSFQNLYSLVLRSSDHEPLEIIYSILFILSMIIQIISLISIIVYFNIYILLVLTVSFLPNIICKFKIQKENVLTWKLQTQNNRQINYYFGLMTDKESLKEVRQYDLYDYFEGKRQDKYRENLSIWSNFGKKEFKFMSLSQLISKIGIFISICWLVIKSVNGRYNISDFIFYSGIIVSLQDVYIELIDNMARHYTSMLFMNQFFKFLNHKEIISYGNMIPNITKKKHILEFKNVWFKYPYTDVYILKDINCSFEVGDRVCIVGENGCGKTTLINLILRIYDPTLGNIYLDGVDIREYNIVDYRKMLCCINQNYVRYAVSVKDCISFGDIENSNNMDKIKFASKKATAHNFIRKLYKAYDSNLMKIFDGDGEELSGGQWQKLSVARVFFSKANILIFDEPTSALDPISEAKIYEEIEKADSDKIKIFISHKMYSSKNATKIMLMSKGKIIDIGTHNELLSRNPIYKKVFNIQAEKYR